MIPRFTLALALTLTLFFRLPVSSAQPASPEKTSSKKEVTSYTLSPEKYHKAVDYSRAKYRLYFISTAYGLLLILLILSLRIAPKFRDWAERASHRRIGQIVVYVPLLLITLSVLGLPTDVYGQWLRLQYDQSVQSWQSWAWDWSKEFIINLVILTFLIWILYGIIRRSPKRWWFYFWLATLPIIVFLMFVSPIVIEPLFFKFEPLNQEQPALVAEIQKVVQRGGLQIPPERMFEMKASEKLKSVNAYVSGFGASQRVVVWDTTISSMTPPQILSVFGHEMGHYVLKHIPRSIAYISLLLLVCLFLGYRGMHWIIGRWGSRWKVRGVEDYASLPVLMLLFTIFGFFCSPVYATYSRWQEQDADIYALEVTHGIVPDSAQAAAQSFQILGEINLSDPNPSPFIKIWLYDHPPLKERIVFARNYDPWSKGQVPKFVK